MNAITKISQMLDDATGFVDEDLQPLLVPAVTDAMFYGLTGDIMRAASNGSEVHPAAVGIAFMALASVAVDRKRYVQIGDIRHHARIYSVHVGRSGIAGKGMALALPRRIRDVCEVAVDPMESLITGNFHDGGLSTREGLAWLIRDESDIKGKDGDPVHGGVRDKRLFVIEEELANVLAQTRRDGNTLSAAIRSAWDGHDIAPATKTNRTRATSPHIGIHACITPSELAAAMSARELSNGFANRFLFCYAERVGIEPYPSPTPESLVKGFAVRLKDAIRFASVEGAVEVSKLAKEQFGYFYAQHRRGFGMSPLIRGLLERHPPYVWRMALLFALLDKADVIMPEHMEAALAWLDYCRQSTVFVFSSAAGEAEAGKAAALAQRVVAELQKGGGSMDREPLRILLCKPSTRDFDAAIRQLIDACQVEEQVIPREGGGRPLRRYRLL